MMTKPKQKIAKKKPDALFGRIGSILGQARGNVVRAVNTQRVLAYWVIGREIVQELRGGEGRAAYGKPIVEDLSARLNERFGNGFSPTTLQYFRKFYLAYAERCAGMARPLGVESGGLVLEHPIPRPMGGESATPAIERKISFPVATKSGKDPIMHPLGAQSSDAAIPSPLGIELALPTIRHPLWAQFLQAFSPQLTWSPYRALMRVESVEARDLDEREAIAGGWDKRTLARQIQSFYRERMLKSHKPEKMLAEGRKLAVPAVFAAEAVKHR